MFYSGRYTIVCSGLVALCGRLSVRSREGGGGLATGLVVPFAAQSASFPDGTGTNRRDLLLVSGSSRGGRAGGVARTPFRNPSDCGWSWGHGSSFIYGSDCANRPTIRQRAGTGRLRCWACTRPCGPRFRRPRSERSFLLGVYIRTMAAFRRAMRQSASVDRKQDSGCRRHIFR